MEDVEKYRKKKLKCPVRLYSSINSMFVCESIIAREDPLRGGYSIVHCAFGKRLQSLTTYMMIGWLYQRKERRISIRRKPFGSTAASRAVGRQKEAHFFSHC